MHFCAAAAAGVDPGGVGGRGNCMWEVQSAAAAARVAAVQFEVGGKLQVVLCRICKYVAAACATRSRNVKRARQQQTLQCIHIVYSLTTRRDAMQRLELIYYIHCNKLRHSLICAASLRCCSKCRARRSKSFQRLGALHAQERRRRDGTLLTLSLFLSLIPNKSVICN